MFEEFRSFADYIKIYELQRAEGLLLRHLAGVHKVADPDRASRCQGRGGARNGAISRAP